MSILIQATTRRSFLTSVLITTKSCGSPSCRSLTTSVSVSRRVSIEPCRRQRVMTTHDTTRTRLTSTTAPSNQTRSSAQRSVATKQVPPPTSSSSQQQQPASSSSSSSLWLKAGLPFVLFSVLASWVVSNALDGKLKEMEASQGRTSKSIRQVKLEQEQAEIMERIGFLAKQEFDNTKRIKRPHEILEERRKEREQRNAWHRRMYRWITRQQQSPEV